MTDERMLPDNTEDSIGVIMNRQICAGIEDIFRDHPDEAGFALCAAGTVVGIIGSVFFGRRAFKKTA